MASISEEEAQRVEAYLKEHPDALLPKESESSATEKIVKRGKNSSAGTKSTGTMQPPSITTGKVPGKIPIITRRPPILPPSSAKTTIEPRKEGDAPSTAAVLDAPATIQSASPEQKHTPVSSPVQGESKAAVLPQPAEQAADQAKPPVSKAETTAPTLSADEMLHYEPGMQRPKFPTDPNSKIPVLKPVHRPLPGTADAPVKTPESAVKEPPQSESPAAAVPAGAKAGAADSAGKSAGTVTRLEPTKPRQGPLSHFRSRNDSSGSDSQETTPTVTKPAPPAAEPHSAPVVEQLSPLERARQAAAKEASRRPQVLGDNKKSAGGANKADHAQKQKPSKQTTVPIRLAPMPEVRDRPIPVTDEPAQKPEIRLDPQVIKDASEGRSAPLAGIMQGHRAKKGGEKTSDTSSHTGDRKKGIRIHSGEVYIEDENTEKQRGKRSKDRHRMGGEDSQSRKRRNFNNNDHSDDDSPDRYRPRQFRTKSGRGAVVTAPRKGDIVIQMPCTVKEFAEATGLSVAAVIKKTMELGAMLTINRTLDEEIAELLIEAFELKAQIKKEQTLEDQFVAAVEDQVDPPETLQPRAPVVTFLGHVDHGKTSLLDKILKLNVVSGERGGITQHIRAYHVETEQGGITFVDTPGHEAFTEMRARGANCTDIAVLVVAADDGVMPQTEEAISHAKAAGVPIVVALNKMDLPGANRERTIQQLANNDLMPSEWGGDAEFVETSAATGAGIDQLMETLLTVAELHELRARPDRPATGVALESSLEPGQGVTCKLLVQNGTLKDGDVVLCGNAYGRVRAMFDTLETSKELPEAGPSIPVTLLGLNTAPSAGSRFVVLPDISAARQIAEDRTAQLHARELSGEQEHMTLETLKERLDSSRQAQTLNIIIRADVRGSIEAIRKELSKL
ncbi:MAG: translation initiation factor IF-2, partial [Thermoguttaceae bacterium]|nr:translation initiation factor IF-2 [Thermoguttaceae bacterium]